MGEILGIMRKTKKKGGTSHVMQACPTMKSLGTKTLVSRMPCSTRFIYLANHLVKISKCNVEGTLCHEYPS